jgi:ATP-dependent DNA helicase RecG
MSILINIEDLLSGEIVEGTRMEFKKGWNPSVIMRTVFAFADQDTDQDETSKYEYFQVI